MEHICKSYRIADETMKKYLSFFKLRFSMGLQYRVAALAGVSTQFFWGFMEIMVYRAFYEADAEAFTMSFSATVSYIWLRQAFLALFASWMMEEDILSSILSGNIAYDLCRPIDLYNMLFSRNLANRLSRAALRCFPILVVAAFLPKPYGIAAPASALHFFLFVITLATGLAVTVALCMLIYVLTFFTVSSQGLRIVFASVTDLLAGSIIPLPFFPEKWQAVLELLPFASMQNVALRIYSGNMNAQEMQRSVFLQVFWLIAVASLGKCLCRTAERKIIVQGG